MKSVMTPSELFTKVAKPKIQRSTFDRSHGYKTTFDSGKLIPVFVDEALPGDTFNVSASMFGRIATPLKPVMDNMSMDIHFFSVPIRLVWDNFKRFMGEQDNPTDTTDYLMPTMTSPAGGYAEGSMMDYLGIPTKIAGIEHRSDILRAIHLIYNQWYRDENLQDSLVVDKGDGPDTYTDYNTLLPRGKRKDYFTSALPWAQKADPVTIPLGTSAPVVLDSAAAGTDQKFRNTTTHALLASADIGSTATTANLWNIGGTTGIVDLNNTHIADLSSASAQTINALREAFQVQAMYEKDARGGTRYTEMMLAHFGVLSPDARLQRSEFLGGGTSNISINPIAKQSESGTNPQGNLAAMGTIAADGKGFIKSFTEHEIVLGFVSVRADLNYQQGINKMWSRSTRFDHYFPSFANLGEQAILNKELYTQGTAGGTDDDAVFGYQERYAEYKYKPSQVTGLFRSNATASLDVWHLSQDFSALPSLNASFIEENPPIDRIIAVPSEPQFILDCYFNFKATRPMPVFSQPFQMTQL